MSQSPDEASGEQEWREARWEVGRPIRTLGLAIWLKHLDF